MICIGGLFYIPSLVMLPIVWIALVIIRPFVWREWFIPFLAMALIFVYYVSSSLWNYSAFTWPNFQITQGQFIGIPEGTEWINIASFGILVMLVVLSGFQLHKNSAYASLRFRKITSLFMFIISLVLALLFYEKIVVKDQVYILVSALPLSILIPFFFYHTKAKWLSIILFYSILGLQIVDIYVW